ncbi:MAG TPA: DUF6714 family protein [Kofleriaceae bacterium]|nr:DUF6714 family protein [Kofleriaceae bacterium]
MSIESEIQKLVQAFPPHPLDASAAFAEWGRTHTSGPEFQRAVDGREWFELEPALLERNHDALVFFGPSSIADYLPAYLASVLRRDPELSAMPMFLFSVLTRGADPARFDARFARLTDAQRRAIASALAAFEAEVAGTSRQQDVTAALDSYWRSQLTEDSEGKV